MHNTPNLISYIFTQNLNIILHKVYMDTATKR